MKCLVIIPTYNEIDNLADITSAVLSADKRLEALIVDDNSPDGTGRKADLLAKQDSRIHVMHRESKLGLGAAYIAGFKYAIKQKYDVIFEMDADFSHDPKYLPVFLNYIESCDVVLGSRYLNGVNVINWLMHRLMLSFCANKYVEIITGLPVCDATGGFKCFRRKVLESINLDRISSEGYAFQIEINYICWKMGFNIREISIVFVERRSGTTKMSKKVILEAIWIPWKLKFLGLIGYYKNAIQKGVQK